MRQPDRTGPCGKAWLSLLRPRTPDHDASLSGWVLHVPSANLAWEYYLASVVHLRPLPGVRPAHLIYPAAGYEWSLFAIAPDRNPFADEEKQQPYALMEPVNVVVQFHGISDAGAAFVCEAAVQAILDGQMMADGTLGAAERAGEDGKPKHVLLEDAKFRPWWDAWIRAEVELVRMGDHGPS